MNFPQNFSILKDSINKRIIVKLTLSWTVTLLVKWRCTTLSEEPAASIFRIEIVAAVLFKIVTFYWSQCHISEESNLHTIATMNSDLTMNDVFRYGGPDSFRVTKQFNVDWSTYLTVNKSIIYAVIDGRGSGLKGNNMLFSIYKHLGSPEIDDQVNVTRLRISNKNKNKKKYLAQAGFGANQVLYLMSTGGSLSRGQALRLITHFHLMV